MILIIEDNVDTVNLIKYYLKDYDTDSCNCYREAMDKLQGHEYSLLIIDVKLPDFTGTYLAEKVRQTSNVPILFLTNYTSDVTEEVSSELGASLLHKSKVLVNPEELISAVEKELKGDSDAI